MHTFAKFTRRALAAVLLCGAVGSALAQGTTWEYKSARTSQNDDALSLRNQAEDGWELKALGGDNYSYFGRQVQNGRPVKLDKEYQVFDTGVGNIAARLTSLGDDSWEPVSISQRGNNLHVVVGRNKGHQSPRDRTRYEYKTVDLGRSGNTSELTRLGLQSWYAVDLFTDGDGFQALVRKDREPMAAAAAEAVQFRWTHFSGVNLERQIGNELRGGWSLVGLASTRTGNYEGLLMKSRMPGGDGGSVTIEEFRNERDSQIVDALNKQGKAGYEAVKLYSDRFGTKALLRR